MKNKQIYTCNKKWTLIFGLGVFGIIIVLLWKRLKGREGWENSGINYLDGIDVIYWINLKRSTDRKNNMEKMFKDYAFDNIPNSRIDAYDGKLDSQLIFDKLTITEVTKTITEYACLLSHLESIRTFNESDHNVALIMEDDATLEFKKYWKKSVKEIMNNAPADWEVIMLNYIYSDNQNVLFYNWDPNSAEYEKNTTKKYYGCLSYLVNKKGSKKLMQFYNNNKKFVLNPNYIPVSDVYIYQSLNTYVYKYPMFVYKTDNDSTIHSDHIPWHVISKNRIINNYNNIEKN